MLDKVVLPEPGFAASLVRAMMTGVLLFARVRAPMKVTASRDEAYDWLAPLLPIREALPVTSGMLARACTPLL